VIGDFLYTLTARDRAAPVLQRPSLFATVVAANATVQAGLTAIPDDQVFILTDYAIAALGGAAQTVSSVVIRIFASEALDTIVHLLMQRPAGLGAPVGFGSERLTYVPVMPNEVIHAIATFSAGAAANTVNLSASGYFIPRGTFQLR